MGALECKKCGRWVDNVGEDTKTVICSYCVLGMVGMPEDNPSYTPTGRPPGWHFMAEYVYNVTYCELQARYSAGL